MIFPLHSLYLTKEMKKIGEIREETETFNKEVPDSVEGYRTEDDKQSFQGDLSNIDSSESEVQITPKRRRRIPPPNPPYRTRRRGRYSMLKVNNACIFQFVNLPLCSIIVSLS